MNQQYDQLDDLIADGMNWERTTTFALLYTEAEFDAAHRRVSQVGVPLKKERLQGKIIDDDGNLCGLPAVFYMVLPDTEYQMILAYDDGRHDELLLGFFDETGDGPITVERRGSLFVRPYTDKGEEPPSYSIWLRPEAA